MRELDRTIETLREKSFVDVLGLFMDHDEGRQIARSFCRIAQKDSGFPAPKGCPCKECGDRCGSHRLFHLSHGMHFEDFPNALARKIRQKSNCNETPVMFLFESPGSPNNRHLYPAAEFLHEGRLIPQKWFWSWDIKEGQVPSLDQIGGGWYGRAIAATALKYGVANCYVTNVVKCGIIHDTQETKPRFVALGEVDEAERSRLVTTCVRKHLAFEIKAFAPRVIIFMSKNAFEYLRGFDLCGAIPIFLPHPARPLPAEERRRLWQQALDGFDSILGRPRVTSAR